MKALKLVLRLNATTCIFFGLLFCFLSNNVGQFIGTEHYLIIMILGIGLVINGLHLLYAASRKTLFMLEIYYFSIGDILWFCATCICITNALFITTWLGIVSSIIVGIVVLSLGLAQLWFYAEHNNLGVANADGTNAADMLPPQLSRLSAIKNSWLGIKKWVKIWLFGLNTIFLMAILFLPLDVAKYILLGFVICGPLLFALMIVQRGLTRLLGIAHLIPWLPLLAYVFAYMSTDITYAETPYLFAYLVIFTIATSICLILDALDIYRWFNGEISRLGAPNSI